MRLVFLCLILLGLNTISASAKSHGLVGNGAPLLSLPIDCVPSKTCFIQNYVDLDPGPAMLDYACGRAGYDGHRGVDIRVLSLKDMARGVKVLASAPGRVIGVRDGMADRRVRSDKDRAKLKGRECGNGVSIAHTGGLVTQYCHMRRGSLSVRRGQIVTRGQKLGLVGLSGRTAFPHVHISVRLGGKGAERGKVVDPFTGRIAGEGCNDRRNKPLWTNDVLEAFPYKAGEILKFGFAAERVALERLRKGHVYAPPTSRNASAMGIYAWGIKFKRGDVVRFTIIGPKGPVVAHQGKPLTRHKAVHLQFAGRKRPKGGWPAGQYRGRVEIIRGGKVVVKSSENLVIN